MRAPIVRTNVHGSRPRSSTSSQEQRRPGTPRTIAILTPSFKRRSRTSPRRSESRRSRTRSSRTRSSSRTIFFFYLSMLELSMYRFIYLCIFFYFSLSMPINEVSSRSRVRIQLEQTEKTNKFTASAGATRVAASKNRLHRRCKRFFSAPRITPVEIALTNIRNQLPSSFCRKLITTKLIWLIVT